MTTTSSPDAPTAELEVRGINVARGLQMDAVVAANSGHTGTALALSPLAHVLYGRIMTYDAAAPTWPDRDRFVLSAGHASMLQYSFLHLCGFGLSLDDIRQFRQWGSSTPGHPEHGHTAGVEVTTGPLGQGFANAVGMAMAERHLRSVHGADVCDHHIFCIASDGDLMEGVSHEAASLAGHQGLGRLVAVYDDNHITIDGRTELAVSDDAPGRFRSYGWHVEELGEVANDLDALEAGIRRAMAVEDRPSLVVLRSHIGYPLPDSIDTAKAHGAITDTDEIAAAKERIGLPADETFWVPDEIAEMYRGLGRRGAAAREAWEQRVAASGVSAASLGDALAEVSAETIRAALPSFEVGASIATRNGSNQVLAAIAPTVPTLIPGSADLTGNTGVKLGDATPMSTDAPGGTTVHYGIREHAMAAAMNGMALHGGIVPVGGTFLVFSDYARPSVRLAALSGLRVIYSFTHDSIGVGEDGPTHQPVEHVTALRAIPGLQVIRPADAAETAEAWALALATDGPTALILTRQNVPVLDGSGPGLERGGYVLGDAPAEPDVVLIGTGSEVQWCVGAAELLATNGIAAQVVSMPCRERFLDQDAGYRDTVVPPSVPAVAVEAGVSVGWGGLADATVTLDRFGASAPGGIAMRELGFTAENVAQTATELIRRRQETP
ncbi:MAG: transketolase [Actinomycetota bacterium]